VNVETGFSFGFITYCEKTALILFVSDKDKQLQERYDGIQNIHITKRGSGFNIHGLPFRVVFCYNIQEYNSSFDLD